MTMEKLFEVFRDSFPADIDALKSQMPILEGNAAIALSDAFDDDLRELKASLAKKNIKVGKFLGAGNISVIFELETMDGKKIESAVVRIESKEAVGHSNHPHVLKSVAEVDGDFYAAQIMPRAEALQATPEKPDALKTISALNARDYLQYSWDLKPDALMKIKKPDGEYVAYTDGTPVLIVGDSNAVNIDGRASSDFSQIIGREFGFKEDLAKLRLPESELAHVQEQMDEIYRNLHKDLEHAGITSAVTPDSWRERTAGEQGWKLG